MIPKRPIRTVYPCCDRRARFSALADFPTETYIRRCRECETTWAIRRKSMPFLTDGIIDILEWQDTKGREYMQRYG